MKNQIFLHQIYYDARTQNQLEPGYIPLDNTENLRPDWYEVWPIKNFLQRSELDPDAFYGFFSPNFNQKTGLEYKHVYNFTNHFKRNADVVLCPHRWDHNAYFQNVFIHGELAHPGLMANTQEFLNDIKLPIDLRNIVNHSANAVFSNNIIAKPKYWRAWLNLIELFYQYVETSPSNTAKTIAALTTYGQELAPMKAFIQERLSTIILQTNSFNIVTIDTSVSAAISDLFKSSSRTRRLLQSCDILKQEYTNTGRQENLVLYEEIKAIIPKAARLMFLENRQKPMK